MNPSTGLIIMLHTALPIVESAKRAGAIRLIDLNEDDTYGPSVRAMDLTSMLVAGMESLGHGLAVFDRRGRLCFANSVARSLMRLLHWSTGEIGTACTLPARWADILSNVCVRGRRELAELPACEPMQRKERPVLTSPVPGYAAVVPINSGEQRLAFAIFGRVELCGAVELEMYALRHGMTPAEGEVLRQLCMGLSATEIARARQVSVVTVLTQIAAIRQKTATRSVRQLMHDLCRMPQLRTVV